MNNSRLVRQAAIRRYFALVTMVMKSARQLDALGIGSDEAIDQALAALPLDRVTALVVSLQQVQDDLDRTARDIEAYQSVGTPYGETYGDLMKWAEEQADEDRETERAADRAAEEGMIDREEEQVTRAEEVRMDAELDNSESV